MSRTAVSQSGLVTFASLACLSASFGCPSSTSERMDGGIAIDANVPDGDVSIDANVPDGGVAPRGLIEPGDISILFPLPASSAELADDSLSAASTGSRGVLFPSAIYDTIPPISGSSGDIKVGTHGDALWQDLHVVAVRVDPCFAALAPDPHGEDCNPNMRLVFQEVRAQGSGRTSAFDSALHVFYRINRDEVFAFAHAVSALRQANASDGARHPLILGQQASSALARGVRALILRYAGGDNLTRVTALSGTDPGFTWSFRGVDVAANGTVAPMIIPTLPELSTEQQLHSGFSDEPHALFSPPSTHADNFEGLSNAKTATTLSAEARATAFAGVVRIHNPSRHTPDTIDCASCHFSGAASSYAEAQFGLIEREHPDAFHSEATVPTLEPFVEADGGFNVHAFSYFSTSAGINQRTVNETAALVAYMNATTE